MTLMTITKGNAQKLILELVEVIKKRTWTLSEIIKMKRPKQVNVNKK